MNNELDKYFNNLIGEELKMSSKWDPKDKFYNFRLLQIDKRGRIGEHFFRDIFEKINLFNNYVDNSHGDWDLEADGLKIEVKTATLDTNDKFQHEGIKESKKWDVIAFLDITPNNLYVTFIYKNEFEFGILELNKNKIYGKVIVNGKSQNIHYRGKDSLNERATGAGYKVDLKLNDLIEVKTINDIKNLWKDMKERNKLK